jgi:microcystin-dependent protein
MYFTPKNIIIILLVLLLIIIYKKNNFSENFTTSSISKISATESIQNMASLLMNSSNNPFYPSGIISMWSGSITDIPRGWVICDGLNNTPNLRGRFILGYNPTDINSNIPGTITTLVARANKMLDIGGEENHVLTAHEMPHHSHGYVPVRKWQEGGHGDITTGGSDAGYVDAVTTGTGGNGAHNNMPPYFVLAYIMKT